MRQSPLVAVPPVLARAGIHKAAIVTNGDAQLAAASAGKRLALTQGRQRAPTTGVAALVQGNELRIDLQPIQMDGVTVHHIVLTGEL